MGEKYRLSLNMKHSESGVKFLSGKEVEVLKFDEGESWEPTIAQVKHGRDIVWVNAKDLIGYEVLIEH